MPSPGGRAGAMPKLGMVGAGQLARMTYQAAISLGITLRLLATDPHDGAARIASAVTLGSHTSLRDLEGFAETCDVVTFDHELVAPEHLTALEARGHCLRPPAASQRFAQDKGYQREQLRARGYPVPSFAFVNTPRDVAAFARRHGWPLVLKATRGGYDGRGVWVADGPAEAERVLEGAASRGTTLLAEELVRIERELAVLVARRPRGESVVYPVVETVQIGGICRQVVAPAGVPAHLAESARELATSVAEATGAVGIMAIELFLAGGRLLVNELAFRPHNSGHYSIEGCVTSQFENHVRAVLDWPLGDPSLVAPAVATVNVLGGPVAGDPEALLAQALSEPSVHVHLYGKKARPGRKLGHVTALGADAESALGPALRAAEALVGPSLVAAGA